MAKVETIKIVANNGYGYVIINAADFDDNLHTVYRERIDRSTDNSASESDKGAEETARRTRRNRSSRS
jgi:hypothetical protein